MTGRSKSVGHLRWRAKIEKGGKGEPHVPALVSDQGAAHRAGYLAGQKSFMTVERAVIETQIRNAGDKPDITLMKNSRPPYGRTVQCPTNPTATDLGIKRVGAALVAHRMQ